ncbi:MAG: hypothetical protein B6I17_00700 [Tenericutes bacterium 4572_104]|nr:MAG: hypothetical protein B6I17_00700 [Tenericutes bacterium 4572_104]
MNIVARLKDVLEIEKLSQLKVDIILLDTFFSVRVLKRFDLKEIEEIVLTCKNYNIKTYISINKMIHEEDLKSLKLFLEELKTLDIDGIVIGDLTVYVQAKQIHLESKIIYQPGTMNTETYSVEYFEKHPIKGVTLSREITLDEIKKILLYETKLELSIIGHGYLDMFYSKRKLLTNYFKYKNISGKKIIDNYNYRLNEEIRPNDFYPILEDNYGTHIFRSHKLISYNEIQIIKSKITDFYIERLFMEDEEYFDSIKLYNGSIGIDSFLNIYNNYDSGFYYKPTQMVKVNSNES